MINNSANGFNVTSIQFSLNTIIVMVLIAWSLIWRGLGLWKSSRNKQKFWFIAILLINSVGLLEIVYLLLFQSDKNSSSGRKLSIKRNLRNSLSYLGNIKNILPSLMKKRSIR